MRSTRRATPEARRSSAFRVVFSLSPTRESYPARCGRVALEFLVSFHLVLTEPLIHEATHFSPVEGALLYFMRFSWLKTFTRVNEYSCDDAFLAFRKPRYYMSAEPSTVESRSKAGLP